MSHSSSAQASLHPALCAVLLPGLLQDLLTAQHAGNISSAARSVAAAAVAGLQAGLLSCVLGCETADPGVVRVALQAVEHMRR